jgi:DNA-directed RNA polymerase II subunit RPB1
MNITRHKELNNAKLDDDYYPMPVNVGRIVIFARNSTTDSDLHFTDQEIFQEVMKLSNKLANIYLPSKDPIEGSEKYRSSNSTEFFRIYMHSELATNKIKDLNRQQIIYTIQEIEMKFKKAIVAAGEMCGILAAQSIGELTTQLTLNSFHFTGISAKNVTLGVPRLKELINITKKLKTPSLTMYENLTNNTMEKPIQKRIIEGIRSSLEYKTLQDIITSSDIIYSYDQEFSEDNSIINMYRKLYDFTDIKIPEQFISLRLEFTSKNIEYVSTSLIQISKLIKSCIGNDFIVICSDDNSVNKDGKENLFVRILTTNEKDQMAILRKIEISCMSIRIKGYEGIEKVYTRENKMNQWSPEKGHYKEDQWILETEGSNLLESMEVKNIDHSRTISNNVIEIYEIFGIEAARQSLLNELRNVLSFDGSYVNYRHLSILTDTMTCRGSLTAITRHGINRIDAGTLTKCSFEETVEILTDAAAFGDIDNLRGISDNIIVGQTVPAGTGVMDIIYDPDVEMEVEEISREPTPVAMKTYIPSEPNYDPLSAWNY